MAGVAAVADLVAVADLEAVVEVAVDSVVAVADSVVAGCLVHPVDRDHRLVVHHHSIGPVGVQVDRQPHPHAPALVRAVVHGQTSGRVRVLRRAHRLFPVPGQA